MCALKLSKRLEAAFELVRRGSQAADVGSDHGRLAARLVQAGVCESVVATEINEAPLNRARALFKRLGLEDKCRALLADGLEGVSSSEADDIVIAGLGGDVIIGIIGRTLWLKNPDKRLILVPTTRHSKLRAYLYSEGFGLLSERAVVENGFCYSLMLAAYCGEKREIDEGFAAIGLLNDGSEEARIYRAREAKRMQKLALSGAEEEKKEGALRALKYISEVESIEDC